MYLCRHKCVTWALYQSAEASKQEIAHASADHRIITVVRRGNVRPRAIFRQQDRHRMAHVGLLALSVDDLTLFAAAFDRKLADAVTLNVESSDEQA